MQFAVISFLYFTPYDKITNIFVTLTLHAVAFITQSHLACKKVLNCGIDAVVSTVSTVDAVVSTAIDAVVSTVVTVVSTIGKLF